MYPIHGTLTAEEKEGEIRRMSKKKCTAAVM
jgi:hypothetical protein